MQHFHLLACGMELLLLLLHGLRLHTQRGSLLFQCLADRVDNSLQLTGKMPFRPLSHFLQLLLRRPLGLQHLIDGTYLAETMAVTQLATVEEQIIGDDNHYEQADEDDEYDDFL